MANEKEGYNGWENYETWAINLWIGNDEGEYEYWRDTAKKILKEEGGDRKEAKYTLASELKDHFEENAEEVLKEEWKVSAFSDLLRAALSEVNWSEIAEAQLEEIKDEVSEKAKRQRS